MQEHSAAAPALPACDDGPPVSPVRLVPAPRPGSYSLVATLANGESLTLGSFADARLAIQRGTSLAADLQAGRRATLGARTLDPETVACVEVLAIR